MFFCMYWSDNKWTAHEAHRYHPPFRSRNHRRTWWCPHPSSEHRISCQVHQGWCSTSWLHPWRCRRGHPPWPCSTSHQTLQFMAGIGFIYIYIETYVYIYISWFQFKLLRWKCNTTSADSIRHSDWFWFIAAKSYGDQTPITATLWIWWSHISSSQCNQSDCFSNSSCALSCTVRSFGFIITALAAMAP